MNQEKCGICHEEAAKYRCPRCSVKYCSLACYKDTERHNDEQKENIKEASPIEEEKSEVTIDLTPELRELLRYNTVKFHLAKVYRILKADSGDTRDPSSSMTTDMKRQLAIDYLNTLRVGGIHHNEAIEEFCVHALEFIEKARVNDT